MKSWFASRSVARMHERHVKKFERYSPPANAIDVTDWFHFIDGSTATNGSYFRYGARSFANRSSYASDLKLIISPLIARDETQINIIAYIQRATKWKAIFSIKYNYTEYPRWPVISSRRLRNYRLFFSSGRESERTITENVALNDEITPVTSPSVALITVKRNMYVIRTIYRRYRRNRRIIETGIVVLKGLSSNDRKFRRRSFTARRSTTEDPCPRALIEGQ